MPYIRSLPSKLEHIKLALDNQSLDILALNETWLDDTIRDIDIEIQNYCIERNDRNREGGGVAIYLNNTLTYKVRKDLNNPRIVSIWIEIKIHKSHKPLIICNIYIPTNSYAYYMEHFINVY